MECKLPQNSWIRSQNAHISDKSTNEITVYRRYYNAQNVKFLSKWTKAQKLYDINFFLNVLTSNSPGMLRNINHILQKVEMQYNEIFLTNKHTIKHELKNEPPNLTGDAILERNYLTLEIINSSVTQIQLKSKSC